MFYANVYTSQLGVNDVFGNDHGFGADPDSHAVQFVQNNIDIVLVTRNHTNILDVRMS
jgi:hypothetical protein